MNRDRIRELDAELRGLYARRRPLTRALRLRSDPEKATALTRVNEEIDERELEYARLLRTG